MSDQPNPTGQRLTVYPPGRVASEWTAESVMELFGWRYKKRAEVVADAHNAELAEATDTAVQEMLLVKQQLADEREKVQTLVTGIHRLYALRDPTCQQQAEKAYEAALAKVKETL